MNINTTQTDGLALNLGESLLRTIASQTKSVFSLFILSQFAVMCINIVTCCIQKNVISVPR